MNWCIIHPEGIIVTDAEVLSKKVAFNASKGATMMNVLIAGKLAKID